MDSIVNFALLKHPINWIIVFMMVLLFGVGAHLVLSFYGIESADETGKK